MQCPAIGIPNPEKDALAWLIEDDPVHLNVSMGAVCIRQRYALLTLSFPQPPLTQSGLSNWLTLDECNWKGVEPCTDGVVESLA